MAHLPKRIDSMAWFFSVDLDPRRSKIRILQRRQQRHYIPVFAGSHTPLTLMGRVSRRYENHFIKTDSRPALFRS